MDIPVSKGAYSGWAGWGHTEEARISSVLCDLFITEFMEQGTGKIRLVERSQIDKVAKELKAQQGAASNQVQGADPLAQSVAVAMRGYEAQIRQAMPYANEAQIQQMMAQYGAQLKLAYGGLADLDDGAGEPEIDLNSVKLVGAKYIVTGKITKFATKQSDFSSGWVGGAAIAKGAGGLLKKLPGGSILATFSDTSVSKTTFNGRLDMRVIDVSTGEVVAVAHEEGTASDVGVKIMGAGKDVGFDEGLVSKVFEPIVKKLAPSLIGSILALDDEMAESPQGQ